MKKPSLMKLIIIYIIACLIIAFVGCNRQKEKGFKLDISKAKMGLYESDSTTYIMNGDTFYNYSLDDTLPEWKSNEHKLTQDPIDSLNLMDERYYREGEEGYGKDSTGTFKYTPMDTAVILHSELNGNVVTYLGNVNPDSAPKTADMSKATLVTPPKGQSGMVINYNGKKTDTGAFKYDPPAGTILLPSTPLTSEQINATNNGDGIVQYKGSNTPPISPMPTPTIVLNSDAYYYNEPKPKKVFDWRKYNSWQFALQISIITALIFLIITDKIYQIRPVEYEEYEN